MFSSVDSNLVPGGTNGLSHIFVHDRETGITEQVSVSSEGIQGIAHSYNPSISADGRFVAFVSACSSNLVPGECYLDDILVHDRETGTTERVSVSNEGVSANGSSNNPSISADGRFVAFGSFASNLVPGGTNGLSHIFVHDRETGITEQVSVSSEGIQGIAHSYNPSISADGRFVAFVSACSSNLVPGECYLDDILVHDRETGTTERVSVSNEGVSANGSSYNPSISADGRFVAFGSLASNLVSGDTNQTWDVFVHDQETGTTERVSVDRIGGEGDYYADLSDISASGQYVVFRSNSPNFPPYNMFNSRVFLVKLWEDEPLICPGDFSGDGVVGVSDMVILLSQIGLTSNDPNFNPLADFDNDGLITVIDLTLFLTYFGQSCEDIVVPGLSTEVENFYTSTLSPLQTIGGQSYNMVINIDTTKISQQDSINLTEVVPQNLELKGSVTNLAGLKLNQLSELHLPQNTRLPNPITIYLHLGLSQSDCATIKNDTLMRYGLCD